LDQTITIIANGSTESVPIGTTIADLIDRYRHADPGLVVELNGELVFPQRYESTAVSEKDRIEFINCGFCG
jgi:thiamine biosynthesis protein ThiS